MGAEPVAAILIHVPDIAAGLAWYQRAFPKAVRTLIEDFVVLAVGEIHLEIVYADEKVAAGPAGTVVYWRVKDFDQALEHMKRIGAQLYRGPMEIQDGLRMCQVQDPWGNCIGLRGPYPSSEILDEPEK
jgi:predicted enzyme related to lactoylglutathione lyase